MLKLRKRTSEVIRTCSKLLLDGSDSVREEGFITICDLLIVFGKQIAANAVMGPLIYEANQNLQNMLSDFVQEHVFIEEEDDGECLPGTLSNDNGRGSRQPRFLGHFLEIQEVE